MIFPGTAGKLWHDLSMPKEERTHPPRLPISGQLRRDSGLGASLLDPAGNLVFSDFHSALKAADILGRAGLFIPASDLFAGGILLSAAERLAEAFGVFLPGPTAAGTDRLRRSAPEIPEILDEFFPPPAHQPVPAHQPPHRRLFQLWFTEKNPALAPLSPVAGLDQLRHRPGFRHALEVMEEFLRASGTPPGPGADETSVEGELLALLLEPIRLSPDSLAGQLEVIRKTWSHWIGDLEEIIPEALGFLAEEHRPRFPPGPGPAETPDFSRLPEAPEAFSEDEDWMPGVVLLAKNLRVWLTQLSAEYGRPINRIDEIPDEELRKLAARGFTALWLIGVWERSRASAKIKRMMGNAEATASAYSLYDYVIASDLGGDEAWDSFKNRAGRYGIRLTTDMVPNHVGIDGRWVIEHPDWFISDTRCPFPSYRFEGPDLSEDERVGIFIEDGYWDHSDAAVVFRRLDRYTGDCVYIYHGNDGTSMPWNDTAQLDYRKAEVREAVIRTILHVARRSPIIRFDAAMTLTRENFRRLWFPEPGRGGDIPSRSAHAMPREEFDRMMPTEFWREVVDRVAVEAPDTLLLAEAFWMLEGYFVRSLGMHRVYNSAFMNMLRNEENAEYRKLIRETLSYDPRILSRYVNFMSNPDEATAVEGFGKGDKYFGICILMVTMPGLPMFGHGQVEGLSEKYGMEFARPLWREEIDTGLVAAHHKLVFPLLRRRREFSGVEHFRLYDFFNPAGEIDENVFAYSNRSEDGRATLVVYNNRYSQTHGHIDHSCPVMTGMDGERREAVRTDLIEALGIDRDTAFMRCTDRVSGLEFIFPIRRVLRQGLSFSLAAYSCHVFDDFRTIAEDPDGSWALLEEHLGGTGCSNLDDMMAELVLKDFLSLWSGVISRLRDAFAGEILEDAVLTMLAACREATSADFSAALEAESFLAEIGRGASGNQEDRDLAWLRRVHLLLDRISRLCASEHIGLNGDSIRSVLRKASDAVAERTWTRSLPPSRILALMPELEECAAGLSSEGNGPKGLLGDILRRKEVSTLLGVHDWEGKHYFRKEGMDAFLDVLTGLPVLLDRVSPALVEEIVSILEKAAGETAFDADLLFERFPAPHDEPDTGTKTSTY